MNDQQFYALWEKFAESNILKELPDDVEEFCKKHQITIDYYIEEFMWLYKNKILILIEQHLNSPTG